MQYKRAKIGGGTYFFTVVTYLREPFLCITKNRNILRNAFKHVMAKHPFIIDAFVLLPDHLHCILTMPDGDYDYSTRWRLIKTRFTREYDPVLRPRQSKARTRKKEQAVWQRRFWEHMIRDEEDLIRHVEYIHYNPVKHGYVKAPNMWDYSSFHKYVRQGLYSKDWGSNAMNRKSWEAIRE